MQKQGSLGSQWTTVLFAGCLAGGVAIIALLVWPQADAGAASAKPATVQVMQTSQPVAIRAETDPAPQQPPERIDVTAADTSDPPLVFEVCVTRLCDMGLRIAEFAQDDEIDDGIWLPAPIGTGKHECAQGG